MILTVKLVRGEVFCEKAAAAGLSPDALAEKVINTYSDCLHKLKYSDMKKGYEECGELNLMLSELF